MKTIFFGNSKIAFSNKRDLIYKKTFKNPLPDDYIEIINEFLKNNNCDILINGNSRNNFLNFKKHFTNIDAAGGLVINANNSVLLIKRLEKWDLPKGKKEKNENTAKCAIREVEEECGINNLEIVKKLKPTFHIYFLNNEIILKTTHWYLMKYNGKQTLKPQNAENITEAIWADLSKFKIDKNETYPNIIEVLNQI